MLFRRVALATLFAPLLAACSSSSPAPVVQASPDQGDAGTCPASVEGSFSTSITRSGGDCATQTESYVTTITSTGTRDANGNPEYDVQFGPTLTCRGAFHACTLNAACVPGDGTSVSLTWTFDAKAAIKGTSDFSGDRAQCIMATVGTKQ
jgi:hypothetical protein